MKYNCQLFCWEWLAKEPVTMVFISQAKRCAAQALSEAKPRVWGEFGETTEKDFQSYSGKPSIASGGEASVYSGMWELLTSTEKTIRTRRPRDGCSVSGAKLTDTAKQLCSGSTQGCFRVPSSSHVLQHHGTRLQPQF